MRSQSSLLDLEYSIDASGFAERPVGSQASHLGLGHSSEASKFAERRVGSQAFLLDLEHLSRALTFADCLVGIQASSRCYECLDGCMIGSEHRTEKESGEPRVADPEV